MPRKITPARETDRLHSTSPTPNTNKTRQLPTIPAPPGQNDERTVIGLMAGRAGALLRSPAGCSLVSQHVNAPETPAKHHNPGTISSYCQQGIGQTTGGPGSLCRPALTPPKKCALPASHPASHQQTNTVKQQPAGQQWDLQAHPGAGRSSFPAAAWTSPPAHRPGWPGHARCCTRPEAGLVQHCAGPSA